MDRRKKIHSYGKNSWWCILEQFWVVEEEEWAMFFTYEHVHCVCAPETPERARCNSVFRYSVARLNLDY